MYSFVLNVYKNANVPTGVVNFSEDGDGVDGGAVPSSVGELALTLVYRDGSARLDGVHHFHVAPTYVLLFANESD